ncbi:hypothetical protein [Klebsiella sp. BIGb0407]|uniref:hypothetical protein n=1 Tax=Klebsiella sp. BIGb0407 TaxID=2940603 RepID=UPI0021673403|nr:hypothetical protein [Klebsiella sp. BIGb0407]MCS3430740.1 hypothetical protein [Klebsiella sp. BIGb0407]
MNLSHRLFEKPRLRSGVTFSEGEQEILIEYRDQSCSLLYDEISTSDMISFLLTIQKETFTTEQLNHQYQTTLGDINDLLRELDRLGLLDEGKEPSTDEYCTGEDFYHVKLLPMVRNLQYELNSSPFYIRMQEGKITRNELIGFAMEYYHLVKMAPGLIAPSLSQIVNEQANKQLIKLFIDEYDHDVMMLASLEAIGVPRETILQRQPLASTFSSCISLGVYSRQHCLSFFSALFLFETPSTEFNELFVDCCKKLDIPSGFYKPIIKHSDINEQESHDTITETLLKTIPVISNEEQITTLINIHSLVEMLHKQDQEIVDYYSHPDVDLYRIFS